jgi:hypothetical protein
MPININPITGLLDVPEKNPSYNSITISGDHDGSAAKVVAVLYGTGSPPTPTGIANGTLYLQYTP